MHMMFGMEKMWLACHGFFLFLDFVLFLLHREKGDFSILMKYIFLIL